jgi:hypothetical protein
MNFPSGFEPLTVLDAKLGAIHVGARHEAPCLWSKPTGYISPKLLRREFACASEFAAHHPEGWNFVVDTRGVKLMNPINALFLRRLLGLPDRGHYIAIAPKWLKVLAWIGQPIFRPTHLVTTEDEALAILDEEHA